MKLNLYGCIIPQIRNDSNSFILNITNKSFPISKSGTIYTVKLCFCLFLMPVSCCYHSFTLLSAAHEPLISRVVRAPFCHPKVITTLDLLFLPPAAFLPLVHAPFCYSKVFTAIALFFATRKPFYSLFLPLADAYKPLILLIFSPYSRYSASLYIKLIISHSYCPSFSPPAPSSPFDSTVYLASLAYLIAFCHVCIHKSSFYPSCYHALPLSTTQALS